MAEMTKQEATLWARGADPVGGDLMLRNKIVGTYRNGVFALTEDGLAELEVDEIEVVEVKAAPKKASKKSEAPAVSDEAPLD